MQGRNKTLRNDYKSHPVPEAMGGEVRRGKKKVLSMGEANENARTETEGQFFCRAPELSSAQLSCQHPNYPLG